MAKKKSVEELEVQARALESQIQEKVDMLKAGDELVAESQQKREALERECERLSCIVAQRQETVEIMNQKEQLFNAATGLMRLYYRHEINTGQHDGKQLHGLVAKYMHRERRLMTGSGWRFSLCRWLLKDLIDSNTIEMGGVQQ